MLSKGKGKGKCKGYNKESCWFSVNKSNLLCSSCFTQKNEDYIINTLGEKNVDNLISLINDIKYRHLVQRGDVLDNILYRIYSIDRNVLKTYLESIVGKPEESIINLRIHIHSNTYLCGVVGFMIRNGLYDSSILPCCLTCMSHIIRNGDIEAFSNISYAIQFDLYGTNNINIRSAIVKNLKNVPRILHLAEALLEGGHTHLYKQYNIIVESLMDDDEYKCYMKQLTYHHLLHNSILLLDNTHSKKEVYSIIRQRRQPYVEELLAKGMHPSRVMTWCMTNDEKDIVGNYSYIFTEGKAPWNIYWI
jgi:hypothetical protein